MTVKSRGPMDDRPSPRQQAGELARTKKPAGRPKGEPSTIVNVRLPLTLVAALDAISTGWRDRRGSRPTAG
jgi:hypothetical protein